jgi:hypothetical protein
MVSVALPTFYKSFGSPAEVGWVLTAFALVGTSADPSNDLYRTLDRPRQTYLEF